MRTFGAAEIENAVLGQPRPPLQSPEIVAATSRAAQEKGERPLAEADVARVLQRLDPLWDELFPVEQRRIVRLLVERVDVLPDALRLRGRGPAELGRGPARG